MGTEEQGVLQGLARTGRVAAARRYQQKIQNSMWVESMGSGLGKGPAALSTGAGGSGSAPASTPEGSCQGDHHPNTPPCKPGTVWLLISSSRNSCKLYGIFVWKQHVIETGTAPGWNEGGVMREQSRRTGKTDGMGKGRRPGCLSLKRPLQDLPQSS